MVVGRRVAALVRGQLTTFNISCGYGSLAAAVARISPRRRRVKASFSADASHGGGSGNDGGSETGHRRSRPIRIPDPSWSFGDLRLSSESDVAIEVPSSVTDTELHRLARRCLIDVRVLPPQDREDLKRGLSDILKCLSVVCDDENSEVGVSSSDRLSAEDLYDVPRRGGGFPDGAPLRDDHYSPESRSDCGDAWFEGGDSDEARAVMSSVRDRKMINRDNQWYFSAETQRGDGSEGS